MNQAIKEPVGFFYETDFFGVKLIVSPSAKPDVNVYHLASLRIHTKKRFQPLFYEMRHDKLWVSWPDLVPKDVLEIIFGSILYGKNTLFKDTLNLILVCKSWKQFLLSSHFFQDNLLHISEERKELIANIDDISPELLYQIGILNKKRVNHWENMLDVTHKNNILKTLDTTRYLFPTIYANIGIYPGAKVYFEVEILESNLMQIGFISPCSLPYINRTLVGVGDDKFSWGMDGHRQKTWGLSSVLVSDGESYPFLRWINGDVVGFCVDLTKKIGVISFQLNGDNWGSSFYLDCNAMKEIGMFPLFPAVSLQYTRTKIRYIFNSKLLHHDPPKGYFPIKINNKTPLKFQVCEHKDPNYI